MIKTILCVGGDAALLLQIWPGKKIILAHNFEVGPSKLKL